MPDDNRVDNIEKLLSDEKALEGRRQALIADLLKQKETAMKVFDEKLAKLGYRADRAVKRSHHKRATPTGADAGAKPNVKT